MNGISKGALPHETSEPVRRRNRVAKSCGFCRHRKLRCDRQHPCGNCVRKNNSDCKYSSSRECEEPDPFLGLLGPGLGQGRATASSIGLAGGVGGASAPRTMDSFASTQLPVNEMQKRLDKMESLVLTLMGQSEDDGTDTTAIHFPSRDRVEPGNTTAAMPLAKKFNALADGSAHESELDELGDSLGMLKLDTKGKSMYHGDSYYGYLFSEIAGVHEMFNQLRSSMQEIHGVQTGYGQPFASNSGLPSGMNVQKGGKMDEETSKHSGGICDVGLSNLPFAGMQSRMSSVDILKRIPSRDVCEVLIERYFVVIEPLLHIVHRPSFMVGFEQFWSNPEKTEVLWIAFFFGVITLGLQSYIPDEIPPFFQNEQVATEWWSNWVSSMEMCSFAGKLTFKPSLLNIRILLLWQLIESYKSDWMHRSWTSIGVLVKVAQSMGLHRDPSWFAVTEYEREERRRLWNTLVYLDSLHSISQGLPLGIRRDENDVKDPLNLDDDEIMPLEETQSGLIAKSHDIRTVPTDTSFSIIRSSLVQLRRDVYQKNQNIVVSEKLSFMQTWEYDTQLRALFQQTPPYLRGRPVMGLDSPALIIQKMMLEFEFLRTIIVLHRRFALAASKHSRYMSSRKEVLNASVTMLELLHWLTVGEDPALHQVRTQFWFLGGALNSASFMHSTTFLGIVLMTDYDKLSSQDRARYVSTLQKVREIVDHPELLNWDPRNNTLAKLVIQKAESMMNMSSEERQRQIRHSIGRQTAKHSARMMAMPPDYNELVLDNLNDTKSQPASSPSSGTTPGSITTGPDTNTYPCIGAYSTTSSTMDSITPESGNGTGSIITEHYLSPLDVPVSIPMPTGAAMGPSGQTPYSGSKLEKPTQDDFWADLSNEFPHIMQDMNMWQS